ncbi:hypothetical protein BpHYR1_022314 [Brachionus plicatilis]|uniref:Uncharacterized protein n=1 Tax=Brachionus plicatilis TaxID=10195 RepID=A0A3M7S5H9_BRAPC|nr:hypothetical protein BpHYR1_022314 [Brachionus plicatilis]
MCLNHRALRQEVTLKIQQISEEMHSFFNLLNFFFDLIKIIKLNKNIYNKHFNGNEFKLKKLHSEDIAKILF